jgi:signal transduction histidine kinase
LRISPVLLGITFIVQAAIPAEANDLMRLYHLALTRDRTVEAAKHQRDAAIEARPQALSQWLPRLSGVGSRERHFSSQEAASFGLTENAGTPPPLGSFGLEDCVRRSVATVRCSANKTSYGLTLSQTLWSYEAYSQLKQADAQAASAEASYVGAQQDLLLRVAQAYLAVLAAQDQLSTLHLEREAYAMQLKQTQDRERTGLGSRSDVEQARSFYNLTAQGLINSENALDDARLTFAVIAGEPPGHIAPLVYRLYLLHQMTRELSRQEVGIWKKLIRVLSHELNNSLGPIASLAQSGPELTRRGDAAGVEMAFGAIGERAEHLHQFIARYSEFAKLPAPRPAPVEWRSFATEIAAAHQCRVIEPLPSAAGWFDRVQLAQALINLLRNAHESGGPAEAIELAITHVGEEQRIEVRDRGLGMNQTVLRQALLPFYSTKRGGTGLGLALVREIMEAHGGRIRLANREEGGLCVTLTLPLHV